MEKKICSNCWWSTKLAYANSFFVVVFGVGFAIPGCSSYGPVFLSGFFDFFSTVV